MKTELNASLKSYQTFGIDVTTKALTKVSTKEEFLSAWQNPAFQEQPKLILGGGSNVLFTKDFLGLVIINRIKGKEIIHEDNEHVWVKFLSGEVWHESVLWTITQGWSGIENMSLIPGTIGAAPMQNIGAYGVELKDVFESLEAIELATGKIENFNKEQCKFGYRESIFKNTHKNQYFIYSVTLKLNKQPHFNTQYGDIQQVLAEMGVNQNNLTTKAVSDAVITIRKSKLPNPSELGNSGSFFKNPYITQQHFNELQSKYPDIKGFPVEDELVKVPAAWLIEQCGWKGKRVGNCGIHIRQPLVLVNYGGANGNEIYALALQIKQSVKDKFGIEIHPEVNII